MANKRILKKDLNYVLGDIIEAVYVWQFANPAKDDTESENIIDEAESDLLIERVLLETLINIPGASRKLVSEAKLDLGDNTKGSNPDSVKYFDRVLGILIYFSR